MDKLKIRRYEDKDNSIVWELHWLGLEELGIKFMPKQSYEEFTVNNTRIAIVAFGYSDKSYNISGERICQEAKRTPVL